MPIRHQCSTADILRPFVVVVVIEYRHGYDNDNEAKRYRNLSVGARGADRRRASGLVQTAH